MTLANTAPLPASAQQHARVPITFLFTVKNEQINLPYSLEALKDWPAQILILDCGSTDCTKEISEQYRAQFYYREWLGYAGQKNWALDNLADRPSLGVYHEVITPKLRKS